MAETKSLSIPLNVAPTTLAGDGSAGIGFIKEAGATKRAAVDNLFSTGEAIASTAATLHARDAAEDFSEDFEMSQELAELELEAGQDELNDTISRVASGELAGDSEEVGVIKARIAGLKAARGQWSESQFAIKSEAARRELNNMYPWASRTVDTEFGTITGRTQAVVKARNDGNAIAVAAAKKKMQMDMQYLRDNNLHFSDNEVDNSFAVAEHYSKVAKSEALRARGKTDRGYAGFVEDEEVLFTGYEANQNTILSRTDIDDEQKIGLLEDFHAREKSTIVRNYGEGDYELYNGRLESSLNRAKNLISGKLSLENKEISDKLATLEAKNNHYNNYPTLRSSQALLEVFKDSPPMQTLIGESLIRQPEQIALMKRIAAGNLSKDVLDQEKANQPPATRQKINKVISLMSVFPAEELTPEGAQGVSDIQKNEANHIAQGGRYTKEDYMAISDWVKANVVPQVKEGLAFGGDWVAAMDEASRVTANESVSKARDILATSELIDLVDFSFDPATGVTAKLSDLYIAKRDVEFDSVEAKGKGTGAFLSQQAIINKVNKDKELVAKINRDYLAISNRALKAHSLTSGKSTSEVIAPFYKSFGMGDFAGLSMDEGMAEMFKTEAKVKKFLSEPTPSDTIEEKVKSRENSKDNVEGGWSGTVWKPHVDSTGNDTIAYGHKLTAEELKSGTIEVGGEEVEYRLGLTDEQAELLFQQDWQEAKVRSQGVIEKKKVKSIPAKAKQIIAEMVYQMGHKGVKEFDDMFLALQEGDYEDAADAMLDSEWAKQTNSRAKELAEQMRSIGV